MSACEQAWADDINAERVHHDSKRRLANARFWHLTCVSEEHQAAERLAALCEPGAIAPSPDASILRIVRGDACVTAEAIENEHRALEGGWRFSCQVCDATWVQPDSGDATAIAHLRTVHATDSRDPIEAPGAP